MTSIFRARRRSTELPPAIHPTFDALAAGIITNAEARRKATANLKRSQALIRRSWAPLFAQVNAEISRVRASRRSDTLFYKYLHDLKAYFREHRKTSRAEIVKRNNVPNHGRLWQDWGTVMDPDHTLRAQIGQDWASKAPDAKYRSNPFDVSNAQRRLLEKQFGTGVTNGN